MPEKPPKDNIVYADFLNKKVLPGPPENQQIIPPEISEEEAKKIEQDIFDNFEPKVWHLRGLAQKSREKFNAYEHLISSNQYREGHYRIYVSQQQPHRLGSKLGKEKKIPQIFSEDEKRFYGKIYEYEREFKEYMENFLLEREGLENKLYNAHSHLKNFKGAEAVKERLERYLEKTDFDFTSFVFIRDDFEGYRKKIETIEEFVKKLIN
ncbi:MAG: hypothetical protein AAB487_01045 [Patescibacteria group bacterium]